MCDIRLGRRLVCNQLQWWGWPAASLLWGWRCGDGGGLCGAPPQKFLRPWLWLWTQIVQSPSLQIGFMCC